MIALPDRGRLGVLSLPALLILLERAGFSGRLRLTSGGCERAVELHAGRPFRIVGPGFCDRLVANRTLSREDAARVAARAPAHGGSEEKAILALQLLSPRALWAALRDHERTLLLDCFAWIEGEFELGPGREPPLDVSAFSHDPLELAHTGVSSRWSVDRTLGALGAAADRFASPGPALHEASAPLRRLPGVEALCRRLDGRTSLAEAARAAGADAPAAALLLHELGTLLLHDAPSASAVAPPRASSVPRIEIRVAGTRRENGAAPAPAAGGEAQASPDAGDLASAVRRALTERRAHGLDLDHYALLGVPRSADAAAIRCAYVAAAKMFHPDAVARLGLDELRDEASSLFARIGTAHAVLSNPSQRREYDESLAGGGAEEAQRAASAETLFRKGEVLLRKGAFDEALQFLRPAAELDRNDAAYQSALGWALFKKQQPEQDAARSYLERAVALDPDLSLAHQRLAAVLRALGKAEASALHLARSRELDARSSSAL